MKTALVVGASGLIGNLLITNILENNIYSKVKIIVRKEIDLTHPKLEQIIVDFDNLDESKIVADDIFCCLGTTMKIAKTKVNFYKVDFTYPLNIAKVGLANGAKQFLLVTAMGADEQSFFYYNQVKGKIEKAISDLHYPTFIILRPSMLSGDRKESRFGEKIGSLIMNLFDTIIPDKYKIITAEKVARAMFELAQKGIKNKDIFDSGMLQKF